MPQQRDIDRDAVSAADDARLDAMLAFDTARLERLMSPECVYIHNSGRAEGREAYLDRIREGRVRYLRIERRDADIRLYGDTAVMIGHVLARSRTYPELTIHHRNANFMAVWIRNGDGGWRMVAYSSTRRPDASGVGTA